MITVCKAAKHVFAFMQRRTVPPRRDRFAVEKYIGELRLELDWAQQTLEAIDKEKSCVKKKFARHAR